MLLSVKDVSSGYRNVPVIKGITFTISEGEIVGLIGLNGAGKSTLLKTILGLIHTQEGVITIQGQSILDNHQSYAEKIAYIPETPILYEGLTLKEHIEMTGLGYGIEQSLIMERALPLLKQFRLEKHTNWFPIHFSKGMKQKVMIICALITDAQLLIIDEPFLGLDPLAIKDFTELLKAKKKQGVSILLTTHILSIAPQLCDRYLMLQAGQLRAQGELDSLRENFEMNEATLEDMYIRMTQEVTTNEK